MDSVKMWFWFSAFMCFVTVWIMVSSGNQHRVETFVLDGEKWTCTAQHTESQPKLLGKIVTTEPVTVCDNYSRTPK